VSSFANVQSQQPNKQSLMIPMMARHKMKTLQAKKILPKQTSRWIKIIQSGRIMEPDSPLQNDNQIDSASPEGSIAVEYPGENSDVQNSLPNG
jgi:hypothetical protein